MGNTVDSNITGLRFAEEESIGVLPTTPVWYPLEPNSYNDFGGQLKTMARNPINPTRQRKKGVITDLDASGGFIQDLTQTGLTRLLQGFFFASLRQKASTAPLNGAQVPITGVTTLADTYAAASGLGVFGAGDLILASDFSTPGNNGLKHVSSATAAGVVVDTNLVDEPAPPSTACLQKVGLQLASGVASISTASGYPRLVLSAGDPTTWGLIPGEWIYIGGDVVATRFTQAANNGFVRIRAIAATYIEFDKTSGTAVTDAGASKTIQLFWGNVLKNEETAALIERRSYQLERTLGSDDVDVQAEYLVGAVPSELSLEVKQADKITTTLSFMAIDNEHRSGTEDVKEGTRPDLLDSPAFNTSSDFSRVKLHQVVAGVSNPDPLFAYFTELTLTLKNNLSPNKAVAVLGAFDMAAGTFEVGASVTAYFAEVAAIAAVRNNADVSLDFAVVKDNAGLLFDLPLVSLGDGRLKVEQDKAITLPLTIEAAVGSSGHTLLLNEFPYLPTVAEG